MLMRTDPFRDLDRLTQQVFGTMARPVAMPMDAFRKGDTFYVKLDLPGITLDAIDLTVEQDVLPAPRACPGFRPGAGSAAPGARVLVQPHRACAPAGMITSSAQAAPCSGGDRRGGCAGGLTFAATVCGRALVMALLAVELAL